MDVDAPTPLLGGLTPVQFMRRHWQKKPLLVRQAMPRVRPPLGRLELFDLVGRDDVESRLVVRDGRRWSVHHGPLARRMLPPLSRPGWTLLVQGLDLHVDAAHEMLGRFRFVPDARLDDLMMSWAGDGGGVGPHLDAYDVFLLQVHGRRRWRVGRVDDTRCKPGLPLKILRRFEPEFDWLLEPGDLLYLPPLWGHDGVAVGECMTCSIGFRAPSAGELAGDLLGRLADSAGDGTERRYRDAAEAATTAPARIPPTLLTFAGREVQRAVASRGALARCLGEALTEPKPQVWFTPSPRASIGRGVVLDRRTRMMYDPLHLFVNGEAFVVAGGDAGLLRRLADHRALDAAGCRRLGADARRALRAWIEAGWLHPKEVP